MATSRSGSLAGLALIIAGTSVALWSLTHPWGSFAGAEVGRTGRWMLSHTFHFLGGLFGLLGLLGFAEREMKVASAFERAGFVLAFVGTTMFAATGVFTAFLWPVLARNAPHLTEVQGPFFSPPHPVILATTLSYSIGYLVFGVALARATALSWPAALALGVGALLLMVPPTPLSPLPWIVFPTAGVVFGIGLASLGVALQREPLLRIAVRAPAGF